MDWYGLFLLHVLLPGVGRIPVSRLRDHPVTLRLRDRAKTTAEKLAAAAAEAKRESDGRRKRKRSRPAPALHLFAPQAGRARLRRRLECGGGDGLKRAAAVHGARGCRAWCRAAYRAAGTWQKEGRGRRRDGAEGGTWQKEGRGRRRDVAEGGRGRRRDVTE